MAKIKKTIKLENKIYIWDKFIRFFHWNLVLGIAAGYITAENDLIEAHSLIGYYLGVLLILRIIWGFLGKSHAKFSNFLFPLMKVPEYLLSLLSRKDIKDYQAHNPASAYMALTLMLVLGLLLISGSLVLGYLEFEGPLTSITNELPNGYKSTLVEIHEIFFDILITLIILHIAGAIISSILHKENLIKAMIHGYRKKVSSHKE